MKSLLLVRHAKSSWDYDVDDFDRPLNTRGFLDAPEMAKRLKKKDIIIDTFVSSPAKRAYTTCVYFTKAFDVKSEKIVCIENLYEPEQSAFTSAILQLPATANCVAIFSHNPGITDFANSLTTHRLDDMPTCAIFAVTANITTWKDFASSPRHLWFFDFPKAQ